MTTTIPAEELRLLARRNRTLEEVVRDGIKKGRHFGHIESALIREDREGRLSPDGRSLAERRADLHNLLEAMTQALIDRLGELK